MAELLFYTISPSEPGVTSASLGLSLKPVGRQTAHFRTLDHDNHERPLPWLVVPQTDGPLSAHLRPLHGGDAVNAECRFTPRPDIRA